MAIRDDLMVVIGDLQLLLSRVSALSFPVDMSAATLSLRHALAAIKGDEAGMYWAWVEATLAAASLSAQMVAVYSRVECDTAEQERQAEWAAKVFRDTLLQNLRLLAVSRLAVGAMPGLPGALATIMPLMDRAESGDAHALEVLALWVYNLHEQMRQLHSLPVPTVDPAPKGPRMR